MTTRKTHNDSFSSAQRTMKESQRQLAPLLDCRDGEFVLMPDGPFARRIQEAGDYFLYSRTKGIVLTIEHKGDGAEDKNNRGHNYQNLFLEEWSNRATGRHGWLKTSRADVLMYHFMLDDELWIFSMRDVQRWAYTRGCIHKHKLVPQMKYEQFNDTWGYLVPRWKLGKDLKHAVYKPKRRTFFDGDRPSVAGYMIENFD